MGLRTSRQGKPGILLKSVFTEEYEVFLQSLISARKNIGITQQDLAKKLKRPQSFVSKYERRERRLDVVEFILISHELGFDPCQVIREIEARMWPRPRQEVVK
jgi:transcriptional regulator with XRE-family HTH domain